MSDEEVITVRWPVFEQRAKYAKESNAAITNSSAPATATGRSAAAQGEATSMAAAGGNAPAPQTGGWEYLDHTADIQIHAWGPDSATAFGAAAAAMFGYMVELDEFGVDMRRSVTASGHDWESMLFSFLDECLYIFHTESLAMTRIVVEAIDTESWTVTASVRGGLFDARKHKQGTEIKAITYSTMQIVHASDAGTRDPDKAAQVYVIVDI
jgi:SHS2 domain-containing protein